MPAAQPGALSDAVYLEVFAYMLDVAGKKFHGATSMASSTRIVIHPSIRSMRTTRRTSR
jgi:hypothetical protein